MTRSSPLTFLAGAAALLLGAASAEAEEKPAKPDKLWVFVGTYTDAKSKGIYRCELDVNTGKLSDAELAAETPSPSFLAVHPGRKHLYAVGEAVKIDGKDVGALYAFSLDAKTGSLKMLNRESSGGSGPCHVTVDPSGKNVLAANYGGGSVCSLHLRADGSLAPAISFKQHAGSGPNKGRQEGPHAHSINVSADNRFAVAADLGLDKLLVYKLDAGTGSLSANDPPAVDLAPGAGPRHFAFHPNGKYGYVINEMDMTMTALAYDADKGTFKKVQTVSTLPQGAEGKNFSTAEVVVHPSGKFVYGSNRGHNSIVAYSVNPENGELTLVGHATEGIKTPRNFNVDPTGTYLIVANQDGASLVVFKIDPKTGELKPTGVTVAVPNPVCVRFVAKEP